MSKSIRVLIADDSPYDAMLLVKELRRAGFAPRFDRVDTPDALATALGRESWDVVICEYNMPQLGAMTVLKLVRERDPDLPVIVVSEVTGDEAAVAAMTAGALDYVLKHKPDRLSPAIDRALQQSESRRSRQQAEGEKRRTEDHLRLLIESSSDIITVLSAEGTVRYESPSVERVLGYRPEELSGASALNLIHPDDQNAFRGLLSGITRDPGLTRSAEVRFRHKDDSWRTLDCLGRNLLNHPTVAGIVLNSRDITERKSGEQALAAAGTVQPTPPESSATRGRGRATKSDQRLRSTADEVVNCIGRYQVIDTLGEGGMGTVYRAHDPKLERLVAVKVPRFEVSKSDLDLVVMRFLREARSAAQIRHPNVCPIYDVDEHNGVPFVVMAYVEGQSLAERLRAKTLFSDQTEAVRLVRQVACGLKAVHAHGIVHRDLKPANILLDRDGQALLADFGLARPEHDPQRLTMHGAVLGTPGYMAPEQAQGDPERIGPRTDLYSLGVVLYAMLTGRLPFQGSALTVLLKLIDETPPPPSSLRPDLDPALDRIVVKAMSRQPEDRYQSAQEFIDALDGWLAAQSSRPAATASSQEGVFLGEL